MNQSENILLNYERDLYDCFSAASSDVWNLLSPLDDNEKKIKISAIREDALTTIICRKIVKSCPSYVKRVFTPPTYSKKLNSAAENRSGMDLHLWIGNNDEEYIPFYIQAKSLRNAHSIDSTYDLDLDQCKKLIAFSKGKENFPKGIPLYFLYQNLKISQDDFLLFKKDCDEIIKFEDLGVLFTHARIIEGIKDSGKNVSLRLLMEKKDTLFTKCEDKTKVCQYLTLSPFKTIAQGEPYFAKEFNKIYHSETANFFFFFFFFESNPFYNEKPLFPIFQKKLR
ncbi:MAG: hypothetical protein NVV82_19445 [Sporocytophaga sp.]|nr:hypothetical protein [Sporocytophaga sp.]